MTRGRSQTSLLDFKPYVCGQGFSIKLEQEQHDSLQRVAHLESQLAKKEQEISQVQSAQFSCLKVSFAKAIQ